MKKLLGNATKAMISVLAMGFMVIRMNQSVSAQNNMSGTDEAWAAPAYVYGGGLSKTEINETANLLGIDSRENIEELSTTGQDLQTYLGYGAGSTSIMISSVLVEREASGSGIDVIVETPGNITKITEEQYRNAAITAGVKDSTIRVGSLRPVSGESALTGVYKAFDANGEKLDQNRMAVAQRELEMTNEISQKLSDDQMVRLDQAIIDIKRNLADFKKQREELATKEDVEDIINETLGNNNLQDTISEEYINQLTILFGSYQQTNAIDSKEVKDQLQDLANDLQSRLVNTSEAPVESGFLTQIMCFFHNVWDLLVSLFI